MPFKPAVLVALMLLVTAIGTGPGEGLSGTETRDIGRTARSAPMAPFSPPVVQKPASDVPWWLTTATDPDRDRVSDTLLADLAGGAPAGAIIDLIDGPTPEDIRDLEALGLRSRGSYPIIHGVLVDGLTSNILPALRSLPRVVFVEGLLAITPGSDVANPAVKVRESAEYSPFTVWEMGYKGRGINICVLDTGVDNGHPTFSGRFVAGADFTKPDTRLFRRDGTFDPDDVYGHGTTCAGIALGSGAPDGKYSGNAPEAGLIDGRVGTAAGFSISAGSFYDSILAGLQWAVANKETAWQGAGTENDGIDIVTISFWGGAGSSSDGQDAVSRALSAVAEAGMVAVTIAGNDGPSNAGIGTISAADLAITTASSDDLNTVPRNDDVIAGYSSRGPRIDDGDDDPWDELKPEVTAPGTNIINAVNARVGDGSGNGYADRGSGTSYAGPNVAGLAALMLEAKADLTPAIVKEILKLSAERRGDPEFPELDPFWNRDFGYGIIDGYNATIMARDLEDIEEVNVRLQAHILGVQNVSADPSLQEVFGVAWNKDGALDAVEYRLDGGRWTKASDDSNRTWAQWHVTIDGKAISRGRHLVEVRAVSGEAHSLSDNLTVRNGYSAPGGLVIGALQAGGLAAALAAAAAVFIVFRKLKRSRAPAPGGR